MELGSEIPLDKQKLFKILVEKDYDEHPLRDEPKWKSGHFLKSLMQQKVRRNAVIEVQKEIEKREKTIKEAKRFKIDNHSKSIFHENKKYLLELNKYIDDKIRL